MKSNNNNLELVFNYIKEYIDNNGFPPSVREISKKMNFASTSTSQYYIKKLVANGLITLNETKNRTIQIVNKPTSPKFVPLIGQVTAGLPILAVENHSDYYPLPPEFSNETDIFMLKVHGRSMINAGISDGDTLIVKKQETCDDGQIIIALIEDNVTCKRLFRKNGKYILHPENEEFQDINLDNVSILGVVEGLIRKF